MPCLVRWLLSLLVSLSWFVDSFWTKMEEVVDGLLHKWKIDDANDLKVNMIEDVDQLGLKRF